jgi:outer membrane lipopolysaccharide assembly protein LptE/RlpB
MKSLKIIVVLLLTLALTACGFHLRKSHWELEKKYPKIVLPETGSHTFYQSLYRDLRSAGIDVLDTPSKTTKYPVLSVVSEKMDIQPLVYGTDGELRRERMTMTVVFAFDTTRHIEFDLSTERERQLNNHQHLGDNAEKIILEREMQNDIIQQLFRYLAT